MLCVLLNHNFINEAQTITQVFFPGERFAFSFSPSKQEGRVIESRLGESAAYASVYIDGREAASYSWPFERSAAYLTKRRIVMLAMYYALQKAVPTHTPWGALTGIRPSKLVREWLEAGFGEDEAVNALIAPFCCHEEKARLAVNVAIAENRLAGRIFARSPNAIGVYVGVPFCPTRCIYCSFNTSNKPPGETLMARYVNALTKECALKAEYGTTDVSSIYIGGGTPTVLPEYLLEKVLDSIGAAFGAGIREYTVEAGRPDTLTPGKLALLRRYGVNRVAVNPQTLNDNTLAAIGRGHTVADFFRAFHMARDAGFSCINTDLIAGLPGETSADMQRNMEALAELAPENITVHTLAVKRASRLNEIKDRPSSCAEAVEEMLSVAAKSCEKAGLYPYYLYRQKNMVGLFENVGYSLPGFECLYNIGMMAEVQTILGIGAGAVSKFVNKGKITREFNAKDTELYIRPVLNPRT